MLAGGSGFLGTALAADLAMAGYEVVNLTRTPRTGAGAVQHLRWDGRTLGPWAEALDGAAAVVNLTGRSVDCRYTAANRREIVESRVHSVEAIGGAIRRCARPPSAWVQTGSLAIYGDAGDRVCDETAPHGDDFSVDVCERWEAKVEEQVTPGREGPSSGSGLPSGEVAERSRSSSAWHASGSAERSEADGSTSAGST